jgi:nicotinamidase-related amidase
MTSQTDPQTPMIKTFEPSRSAVVLIEFQNQWTDGGLYHRLIRQQLASRSVLDRTRAFLTEARSRGSHIIHAPLVIDPHNKRGLLANISFGRIFTQGSHGAEITQGLYQSGDLVVEGRYAFDAFLGSNLEELLRIHEIRTLFMGGFITDQCIAKTLRTALRKGFDAYLTADCTATYSGMCNAVRSAASKRAC